MTVIAIMGIVLASVAPAIVQRQRASNLTQAGNRLADMITSARQTSLSRNMITAVIFVTSTSDATLNGRVLGFLEMGTDRVWKQSGGWVYLPEAVEIQDMNGAAPHNALPMPSGAPAPQLARVKGDANPAYSALVFYPDGRMRGDSSLARQVRVHFQSDAQNASPANYYDVVLNSDTATMRIQRP
ncbi:MAG: hypothetical protein BGO12_00020 [Verrucomicrobia bacterium 61-8]|nr:MAG: hypothetical protein BGO12_00020 [Verrucomicrobia bacterium 61-8]